MYVCQVVPTIASQELQAKVCDYNEHLLKWGESNGVTIIKTELAFRLGTGKIGGPVSNLNRLGVIVLPDF